MAVTKRCVVCGKLYQATANAKTCSPECKAERNRIINTEAHNRAYYRKKKKKEIEQYNSTYLDNEIQKAKEMGVSYGKYKAMQFLFREKAERMANKS